jgi:hypothetical protein
MAMMSFAGTVLMSFFAGSDVVGFVSSWMVQPTWYQHDSALGSLIPPVPLEFIYLTVNFVGNWNAKAVKNREIFKTDLHFFDHFFSYRYKLFD